MTTPQPACVICGETSNLIERTERTPKGLVKILECQDSTPCWARYNRRESIFNPCQTSFCGGTIQEHYGERKCHLCGQEYDEKMEMIIPTVAKDINLRMKTRRTR